MISLMVYVDELKIICTRITRTNAYIHDTTPSSTEVERKEHISNINNEIQIEHDYLSFVSCSHICLPQGIKGLTTNPSRNPLHSKASHELQPGTTHREVTDQIPYQRDKLEYSGE